MELDHRENAGDRLSLYACLPCRQAKRRCDRTYPQCTLCSQKRIRCEYPSGRKTREVRRNRKRNSDVSSKSPIDSSITDPDSIPISEIRREDEQRIISESAESTVLAERFLDPEVFHRAQLEVQSLDPAFAITNEVSDLVGGLLEIKATAKKFFETVHTWMPIVSKNQFTAKLPNRLAHRRAELYLLVLAMKLCHAHVSADKRGLYRAVKQLYFEVELSGIFSILVLQSGILIAIHELGQGIYPAAFLSVGCCARYATALGFNNSVISPSSMVRPWDEEEERRRVWWSILVLDRYLNLCDPQRHLITPDPGCDNYLPVDDTAWDAGTSRPEDAFTLVTANSYELGLFARFAQAAHLLSKVLRHAAEQSTETGQLRRTIFALVHVSRVEASMRQLEYCSQMAVCYSAILLLDHPHPSLGVSSNQLSVESSSISDATLKMCLKFSRAPASRDLDRISPFLLHLIYKVASIHLGACHTSPSTATTDNILILKETLKILSHRWLSANAYLSLLERQEILLALL